MVFIHFNICLTLFCMPATLTSLLGQFCCCFLRETKETFCLWQHGKWRRFHVVFALMIKHAFRFCLSPAGRRSCLKYCMNVWRGAVRAVRGRRRVEKYVCKSVPGDQLISWHCWLLPLDDIFRLRFKCFSQVRSSKLSFPPCPAVLCLLLFAFLSIFLPSKNPPPRTGM